MFLLAVAGSGILKDFFAVLIYVAYPVICTSYLTALFLVFIV